MQLVVKGLKKSIIEQTKSGLVVFTDEDIEQVDAKISGLPKPQLITVKEDVNLTNVKNFIRFESVAQESGSGIIRYVMSNDSGKTWYVYKDSKLTAIELSLTSAKENGMNTKTLNEIPTSVWNEFLGVNKTVKFAYYLEIKSNTDIALMDELILVYQAMGKWNAMVHGRDYDYSYESNEMVRVKLYNSGDYKINYFKQNPKPDDNGVIWEEFDL